MDKNEEDNSLENATTPEVATPATSKADEKALGDKDTKGKKPSSKTKGRLSGLNIYLLLFIFVLVIAGLVALFGYKKSNSVKKTNDIATQSLSKDDLSKLQGGDVKIGDSKQTLSVQSNAVFAGKVLVQGGTDLAGGLKVNGTLSASSLDIPGKGSFTSIQVGELASSGNVGVQGQLTVQKSINVSGGGSFGGAVIIPQLTVDNFSLTNDLQLGRHIDAGGNIPIRTNGGGLGAGGTASNNGTDTAGTVTIGTGGSPSPGCFVSLVFVQKFGGDPHIVITPTTIDSAGLNYYVTHSTTSFSICATNPIANKSYSFDYFVID